MNILRRASLRLAWASVRITTASKAPALPAARIARATIPRRSVYNTTQTVSGNNNKQIGKLIKQYPVRIGLGSGVATVAGFVLGLNHYCNSISPNHSYCVKLRTSLGLDPIVRNVQLQAKKHVLRSRPLSHIHAFFNDLPEGALPICGIWGGSGTGKTELAKSYAHQYASEYHHICAIDGKNWQQGYKRLAQDWKVWPENYPSDVDLSHEDNRPLLEMVIRAVHQKLDIAHGYLGTKRSLLIFDDISPDFFQRCLFNQLPTKHTDILVTSTKKGWEHEVDMSNTAFRLTIDEGKAILRGWVSQDCFDPDEAKKIVTEMEHLPLLLALAGSYLSQIRTLPLKDYLPRFRKERRKVMETGGQSLQHAGLVASIEMVVEKLSPQSKHLLAYCAYLPPKGIPIPFLQKLLGFSAIDLDAALAPLSAFLVGSNDTLAIHNNYQQILQGMELLSDAELSLMAEYIDEKNNLFLSASHNAIKILEASIRHAEKSCHYEKMVNLTTPLVYAYSRVGGYGTLLETLKQVLEIVDKQIGDKDLLRAIIYNNVGITYGELGDHTRALEYKQKALEIRKEVLGESSPDTATFYNNVGITYRALGDHTRALEYQQKALEIRKEVLGESSPDTASSYNNVGVTYGELGDHTRALEYKQKALEIRKEVLGERSPDTASSYNNVGVTYVNLGEYKLALSHLQKALSISELVLGESHPKTILYRKNYEAADLIMNKSNKQQT